MQWILIEGGKGIGYVITVGNLATWPEIVRREIKQG